MRGKYPCRVCMCNFAKVRFKCGVLSYVNPYCLVYKVKKLHTFEIIEKIIEWNVDKGNILQKCYFVVCTYLFHLHIFRKKRIKVFYMMEKNVNFWSNFYHHHAIFKPSPSSFLSLYRSTIVQWFKENSKLSTAYLSTNYSTGLKPEGHNFRCTVLKLYHSTRQRN